MGLRYLITGGAGFIGSHLAEALLERGNSVDIIDDLSTGSITNIDTFRSHPALRCFWDTVFNEQILAELVDRADVIFHLAASVGVRLIVESPVRTIETNIHGTEVVLKHAAKKGKKVFIASTSEVYGKSTQVPFREDQDPVLGPPYKGRWSYACSKLIDEFLALAYWREKKLPVVVVRFFNTVGPRQTGRYGMVLPNFVHQALGGAPITVFGDGTQSRSFTYVGDVVQALLALATHPGTAGQIFNIGNPVETTIGELAVMVRRAAGSESEIVHIPYDEAYEEGFEDMLRRVPDIARIRALIGFEPTVGIREIVEKVIAFQRSGPPSLPAA